MKQRVITAAVALVLFIPIIWIGGIAVELTAAVLAVVAFPDERIDSPKF